MSLFREDLKFNTLMPKTCKFNHFKDHSLLCKTASNILSARNQSERGGERKTINLWQMTNFYDPPNIEYAFISPSAGNSTSQHQLGRCHILSLHFPLPLKGCNGRTMFKLSGWRDPNYLEPSVGSRRADAP